MSVYNSKIEKELILATKVRVKENDDEQNYLARIIKIAISDLSDDEWESLTETTQEWINDGVDNLNDGFPVKCFPDAQNEFKVEVKPKRVKIKRKKQPKSKTVFKGNIEPQAKEIPLRDDFGLLIGSKSYVAVKMFRRGAKMKEVRNETGMNHYNLLNKIKAMGHTVEMNKGLIKITKKK